MKKSEYIENLFFVPEVAQHLYEILTTDSVGEIRK